MRPKRRPGSHPSGKRGGRKLVLTPDGAEWAPRSRPRVDNTPIQARAGRDSDTDPRHHARLDAISRSVVAMVVDDLERAKPELVFVPRTREHLGLSGVGFDFLGFFGRKPRFAKLWSDYAWVEDTPSFRVYARRSEAPGAQAFTSAR